MLDGRGARAPLSRAILALLSVGGAVASVRAVPGTRTTSVALVKRCRTTKQPRSPLPKPASPATQRPAPVSFSAFAASRPAA